jgi:hypothetical protein
MFNPIAKNEMARKYMYVCHTVSCTELFDPATTAAAMNWAFSVERGQSAILSRRDPY